MPIAYLKVWVEQAEMYIINKRIIDSENVRIAGAKEESFKRVIGNWHKQIRRRACGLTEQEIIERDKETASLVSQFSRIGVK